VVAASGGHRLEGSPERPAPSICPRRRSRSWPWSP